MTGPIYSKGRRDESEALVVRAFRQGGATVYQLSAKDAPDLLVGHLGETHLVEVKTGKAKLREGQAEFAETWKGRAPVVCRNEAQARKWLRVWETESQETRIRFPYAMYANPWDEAWSGTLVVTSGNGPSSDDPPRGDTGPRPTKKKRSKGR